MLVERVIGAPYVSKVEQTSIHEDGQVLNDDCNGRTEKGGEHVFIYARVS